VDDVLLDSKKMQRWHVNLIVFLCDEERRLEGLSQGVVASNASDDGSHGLSSLYQLVRMLHVVAGRFCYLRIAMGLVRVDN
jgi:hypothetical protein